MVTVNGTSGYLKVKKITVSKKFILFAQTCWELVDHWVDLTVKRNVLRSKMADENLENITTKKF